MSLAFLRKAFGIKKSGDERDFEDFLKVFENNDAPNISLLSKLFKKKSTRLVVFLNGGSVVAYDSCSQKEPSSSLPTFTVCGRQCSLSDLAFGSYSLNNKKKVLYSIKVHDLSSSGHILLTRIVNDIEDWRAYYLNPNQSNLLKRTAVVPYPSQSRAELHPGNCVAICLLINLDWAVISTNSANQKCATTSHNIPRHALSSVMNCDNSSVLGSTSEQNMKNALVPPNRFYYMLFEHCVQFSLFVEMLYNDILVNICNLNRTQMGKRPLTLDADSCESIVNAFNSFLNSFRDLCLPKLSFPIWSTLNMALFSAPNYLSYYTTDGHNGFTQSWHDLDANSSSRLSHFDINLTQYDNLTDIFVRSCLNPLITRSKGKDHRNFLGRLITGILMFHTGWIGSIISNNSLDSTNSPENYSSAFNVSSSTLLNQLLSQAGSMATNLEAVAGNIFNCTVISGQSRQYLLALLYCATYFVRFTCLACSRECVPELGQADLFELEQQKRRSRLGGKTRRKSGSATSNSTNCGEAHDSGISSQEDLTNMVYSASTGSSPAHASSGMTSCMHLRLTRDQCRIAEAAAHVMVSRESAAAAAAAAANLSQQNNTSGQMTSSISTRSTNTTTDSSLHNNLPSASDSNVGTGLSSSPRSGRSKYTEVPLLIEKYFDDEDNMCACLSSEVFPGYSQSIPQSISTQSRSDSHTSQPFSSNYKGTHLTRSQDMPRVFDSNQPLKANSSSTCHLETTFNCAFDSDTTPSSFVNHCMIGHTISDYYHSGYVLQATMEGLDSLKSRLEENLIQWITYGPLILRGINLSNKSSDTTNRSHRSAYRQVKYPKWSATGLLIDSDNRNVEVLTVTQPNPLDITEVKKVVDAHSNRYHTIGARAQFRVRSNHDDHRECTKLITPIEVFKKNMIRSSNPVKAAPLVLKLLEQTHAVIESTNCATLTLNNLESGLQLIYRKSSILTDLLIKEENSLLQQTDRMVAAAGCSHDDLPLLLSITSACSTRAAAILHNNQFEWWKL